VRARVWVKVETTRSSRVERSKSTSAVPVVAINQDDKNGTQ